MTSNRLLRRLAVGLVVAALVSAFAAAGIIYNGEHPEGAFLVAWNWYVALGLGLLATGALSLLFYFMSSELPSEIQDQVSKLLRQLQSPIAGYAQVTNHIIEVCESAHSHYFSATLMPLVGAVGDADFYQRYRQALVDKINSPACCVDLVFLDDTPLEQFMRNVIDNAEYGASRIDADDRVALVKNFIARQLIPWMHDDEYKLRLRRTGFIPYQVCIADGARAVLYFGQTLQLERESTVRAFYTEDRAVIEVLNMGFEQMREAAQPVT